MSKRRRRRASQMVLTLAAVCAGTALAIGGFELHAHGWGAFLDRPAGVGATPAQPVGGAAAPSSPQP